MSRRRQEEGPPPHAPVPDEAPRRPRPANLLAERLILGMTLLNDANWREIETVPAEAFSLHQNRLIFCRMQGLAAAGHRIDRVTLIEELQRHGELEASGGFEYIISLDDRLPEIANLKEYVRIVLEKHRLWEMIVKSQSIMDRCFLQQEDPSTIAADMENSGRGLQVLDGAEDGGKSPDQIVTDFPGGIGAFLDPSSRARGIQTGFTKLDEMTGGFRGGELIILAARPSMGKTALAMNITYNFAKGVGIDEIERDYGNECYERLQSGQRLSEEQMAAIRGTAVFSLEMSGASLLERMICSEARVEGHKFRLGYLSREERAALQATLAKLSTLPIFIDDNAGSSLLDISRKLRHLVRTKGVKEAIIDYIQLMSGPRGSKSENRNQEVSVISRGLKLLAKELNIPIVVLSQLSRAVETRAGGGGMPQLSDLRDSGSLEQDADLIGFIYREEVYKKDRKDIEGLAEVIIGKQRNGPIGRVPLRFLKSFTRFENRADREDPPTDSAQRNFGDDEETH